MDFRGFFNKIKDQVSQANTASAGSDDSTSTPRDPRTPDPTGTGPRPEGSAPRPRADGTGGNPAGLQNRDPAGTGSRKRTEGLVQNEKDDSVYNLRSEHIGRIEAMFGEFGPTVSSYMLTQSLSDGGVRRVLIKLNLTSRGRDGADLAQIENWILRHGVEKFCDSVKLRHGKSAAPPPPIAPPPVSDEPRVTVRPIEGHRPGHQAPGMGTPKPGPQQARPRPVGQENSAPANSSGSPLQKVAFTPIGLVGKDLQRANDRPEIRQNPPPPPPTGPLSSEGLLRSVIEETGKGLPQDS